MSALAGKNVLIFQQRQWGIHIGHYLAKQLQAEGCKLAALTSKFTTHQFVLSQKEVKYELVISNDEVMSRPQDYLGEDRYSLEEICEDLGVDSIWPLIYTLRNHVRSYAYKWYYGYRQNVCDEDILAYVRAVYKYIRKIFMEFKPDVIIAPNFVALYHIMMNLYAAKRNIKMIAPCDSKVRGRYIFIRSYKVDDATFFDHLDRLDSGEIDSPNRDNARAYIKQFEESFIEPEYQKAATKLPLKQWIKQEIIPYYEIFLWYTKRSINVHETTGITLDYRPPRIILRDHYSKKRYRKFMDTYDYVPLEKIGKCVFYPLQFQPELQIDVMAPYGSNQLETARQIAMSLPGDYCLVAKEHPAMADKRPPSYIEKLAKTPNVKLIDYRVPSEQILKKADMLICGGGTVIFEAAIYRKPVIQFGNMGTTLRLPNVFKHTDMTTISGRIKEVLAIDLHTDEYVRRMENFVAAAFDTSFDANYRSLWKEGADNQIGELWDALREEICRCLEYTKAANASG